MKRGLGFKVLVVEDDQDICATFAELLTNEGYRVETAATAAAGLDRLSVGWFHLVIADYWLPDHNGVWMLQEAAKTGRLAATKKLVVTADPNPIDAPNLRVLRKPLGLDAFLGGVSEMLGSAAVQEATTKQD